MAADVKGLAVVSARKWITRTYGSAAYERALEAVPADARDRLASPLATSWIPLKAMDALWWNVIDTQSLTIASVERAWKDQGRFIAEDNLNTVLRAVLTFFVTPKQLFGQFPRLWGMYFRGLNVRADPAPDGVGGTVTVRGAGALRGLAPAAYGWTYVAFDRVGAKDVRVVERGMARGELAGDPLVFDVSWRS